MKNKVLKIAVGMILPLSFTVATVGFCTGAFQEDLPTTQRTVQDLSFQELNNHYTESVYRLGILDRDISNAENHLKQLLSQREQLVSQVRKLADEQSLRWNDRLTTGTME